jgi:hypothetical protein
MAINTIYSRPKLLTVGKAGVEEPQCALPSSSAPLQQGHMGQFQRRRGHDGEFDDVLIVDRVGASARARAAEECNIYRRHRRRQWLLVK